VTSAALSCHDLGHTFHTPSGPVPVLRGVNLELAAGEVLAIVGASGSGKSTLLHLLAGLDLPSQGQISWAGRPITGGGLSTSIEALARRRASEVGLIFQHHHLLADLTALQNIALPGLIAATPDPARAQALMALVGLTERAHAYPETLSGGERQRVALARALAVRPQVLLADEPTGSLDRANAERMFALLIELAHQQQTAVVIVTHDEGLASQADCVRRLTDGVLA
jgi:lipoprotein-releasing system ATP-binding protein